VTVERADGTTEQVPATKGEDGRWHADTKLYAGDRAYIAEGGIVDGYGESNAQPSNTGEGTNPRPTPTPTATPTPTEEPPAPTTVEITDGSDDAAQYSDEAVLEASVLNDDQEPVSGAEVTFELLGADGVSSYTATTDDSGLARTRVVADRVPGSYNLTARYDGDDDHVGSADASSFTIEKEDAALALDVTGQGSSRTLVARLADADSDAGIAGRTLAFSADDQPLGKAVTKENGVARLDLPPRFRNGHHEYEASFDGDAYYLAGSDRRQT
jgi:hypothetical protein